MIPDIWCFKKNGFVKKFYTGDPVCRDCKKPLEFRAFVIIDFNKVNKRIDKYVLCDSCFKEKPYRDRITFAQQWHECFLCDDIAGLPSGVYPFNVSFTGLSDSKSDLSVFDAASQKAAPSEKVVDRTVLAGRESFEGAQIGVVVHALLEEKEQPVNDKMLEDLR